MDYMSVKEAAQRWSVSDRWVRIYCSSGRIPGCMQAGRSWLIPINATKPKRKTSEKTLQSMCCDHLSVYLNVDYPQTTLNKLITQDDLILCDIQNEMLCGNIEEAHLRCRQYIENSKDTGYLIVAMQIQFMLSKYLDNGREIKLIYPHIKHLLQTQSYPFSQIYIDYYSGKKSKPISFSALPSNVLPQMLYLFEWRQLVNHVREKKTCQNAMLELYCRIAQEMGNETISAYFHAMLALYYAFIGNQTLLECHIQSALGIILPRKWYLIIAEHSMFFNWHLEQQLDAETLKKIDSISKHIADNTVRRYLPRFVKDGDFDSLLMLKVAFQIATQKHNLEISENLGISIYTVKQYIAKIYEITGVSNRKEFISLFLLELETL